MNIAILGGRFDPPHIGHYLVAQQVLEFGPSIDKVLLVPAFQHQWKPILATPEDRLAMLSSFKKDTIEVSDIEIKRKGISYTIDTVKSIKEETNADIYWIVGTDIISEFNRWEKADELTSLATFLVFPRDPYHLPEKLPTGFEIIRSPKLLTTNFSSTLVRERVKEGKSIQYIVPEEIEKYIKAHKLYA